AGHRDQRGDGDRRAAPAAAEHGVHGVRERRGRSARKGGNGGDFGAGNGAKPPRIPPALLGPLLVGGVFALLALGIVAVVLFAG
ncbi:hypothetical protein ACIQOV_28665, partial [Kitasatospora sp. NPDC091257]|uniref:hypothetical protein n=1 Tax=Kitasatospora sp. NPDC091257 TaxID=3364084 RepID=UPI0037FEC10B